VYLKVRFYICTNVARNPVNKSPRAYGFGTERQPPCQYMTRKLWGLAAMLCLQMSKVFNAQRQYNETFMDFMHPQSTLK
jgi:hypothetical protein